MKLLLQHSLYTCTNCRWLTSDSCQSAQTEHDVICKKQPHQRRERQTRGGSQTKAPPPCHSDILSVHAPALLLCATALQKINTVCNHLQEGLQSSIQQRTVNEKLWIPPNTIRAIYTGRSIPAMSLCVRHTLIAGAHCSTLTLFLEFYQECNFFCSLNLFFRINKRWFNTIRPAEIYLVFQFDLIVPDRVKSFTFGWTAHFWPKLRLSPSRVRRKHVGGQVGSL